MFPLIVQELLLISMTDEVPCTLGSFVLDEFDETLVKKDTAAKTA
jgi:hypothetical protein